MVKAAESFPIHPTPLVVAKGQAPRDQIAHPAIELTSRKVRWQQTSQTAGPEPAISLVSARKLVLTLFGNARKVNKGGASSGEDRLRPPPREGAFLTAATDILFAWNRHRKSRDSAPLAAPMHLSSATSQGRAGA